MNKRRSNSLAFFKMHSLGNDFMVIDRVSQSVNIQPEQIRQWGDRQWGVGFDQLLMIEPPTEPDADFYYRIYNTDGSSAEQCGNGTRCVALLAKHIGLTKRDDLVWQSAAGPIQTHLSNDGQAQSTLTVPVLSPEQVPVDLSLLTSQDSGVDFLLKTEQDSYCITPVSMGNPHAVMFLNDIFNIDVDRIGGLLTRHPAFPQGANIGFCQVVDRQFIRLRVYERGVGETQACGSGACAAVVAARLHDHVDDRVKVSLPGGKLRIAWPGPDQPVTMAGPAVLVYRGEMDMEPHAN